MQALLARHRVWGSAVVSPWYKEGISDKQKIRYTKGGEVARRG